MCMVLCWSFEKLTLGWHRRFFPLLGARSVEIYLLTVSLFSELTLIRQILSFGTNNQLYFLLSQSFRWYCEHLSIFLLFLLPSVCLLFSYPALFLSARYP